MKSKKPIVEVPESALRGVVRTSLDSPSPTSAQLARKERNMKLIAAMNLPVTEHLPVVEDESSLKPREPREVAERCVATMLCAVRAETDEKDFVDGLVKTLGAANLLSPEEKRFLDGKRGSDADRAKFGWRYECVHVFLWALGHLPHMFPPNRIADVAREVAIVRDAGKTFVRDARTRAYSEILDAADLYYRLDWAAIELRLRGKHSDAVDEEIVVERHRALNWLIRYMNQDWDDVTTDT